MSDVIWTSVGNAQRIGDETGKLIDALSAIMAERQDVGLDLDTLDWDSIYQEDEWVTTTYLSTYRFARGRGRGRPVGTLTVSISLWRKEDELGAGWAGARRAKVYVGYAHARRAAGWSLSTLWVGGDGHAEHARPISSRRWGIAGTVVTNASWFFCVALGELRTRDDLVREIVDPVARLLAGVDDEEAFADCRSTLPPPPAAEPDS